MPLIFTAIVSLGISQTLGWRLAMIVPGVLMLIMSVLYWKFTQDTPQGNIVALRAQGITVESGKKGGWDVMKVAARNYRVWILAACYGATFGVELLLHGVAASYYFTRFHLSVINAGYAAGSFGLLALFARALGGIFSDRIARTKGLDGRIYLLSGLMLFEGIGLIAFSRADTVGIAIICMLSFGLFTHMACGSIYALVPFIDRKVLGGVAGIIGAGGNIGAVAAGFLLRGMGSVPLCLFALGLFGIFCGFATAAIRFSVAHKEAEQKLYDAAVNRDSSSGMVSAAA
jgi:NNP family nitrate/nitrite transporter-like MFS transporter